MGAEGTFRPGDRALYRFGGEDVEVEVLADPLGIDDGRAVHIRIPLLDADPLEIAVAPYRLRRVESVA